MKLNIELQIKDKKTNLSLDLEDNLSKEYLDKVLNTLSESLVRF
jgi:hypothetical protein